MKALTFAFPAWWPPYSSARTMPGPPHVTWWRQGDASLVAGLLHRSLRETLQGEAMRVRGKPVIPGDRVGSVVTAVICGACIFGFLGGVVAHELFAQGYWGEAVGALAGGIGMGIREAAK